MERVVERFGVKGTLELVQLIAWENARARMNLALDIGARGLLRGQGLRRARRPTGAPRRRAARVPAG